jgi:dipeptidase D
MKYILDHNGKPYLKYFEDICALPHESFNERAVSDYIVAFAKKNSLAAYQDDLWNVVVKKEASDGYEGHPPVMLQAHIDMVCVKIPESSHDFSTDPLDLYVEDGWLKARGTSLGADCGAGVAILMAILADSSAEHPPLECFFSVQEEVGIGGPRHVDVSLFDARRLIATDMIFDCYNVVTAAHVKNTRLSRRIQRVPHPGLPYVVDIRGGSSGHCAERIGSDICNAVKLGARILQRASASMAFGLIDLQGGSAQNSIPGAFRAILGIDPQDLPILERIVDEASHFARLAYGTTDPNLSVEIRPGGEGGMALEPSLGLDLVHLLHTLPSGVLLRRTMSNGLSGLVSAAPPDGMVLSSMNLERISLTDDELRIGYMVRSNIRDQVDEMFDTAQILCDAYGFRLEVVSSYPGYLSDSQCPLSRVWAEVFKEYTGQDLLSVGGHSGTDVGTIMERVGISDIAVVGVNMVGIHTPREAVELVSFDRSYKYINEILRRI